jgi:hypothetical protein
MGPPVDVAPEVVAALQDTVAVREVRHAIAHTVRVMLADELDGWVRPWDLPALRERAATLGEVSSALAVRVDAGVLVAELRPGGQRLLFRRIDNGWRLVRFVLGDDEVVRPETTRKVPLSGWGPDAVLAALGIEKPDDIELEVVTTELGQGETETCHRYQWVDDGRSVLAEQVTREIFDGATPSSTYLHAVITHESRGLILHGRGDTATVTEG